jgi:hypothetical protein
MNEKHCYHECVCRFYPTHADEKKAECPLLDCGDRANVPPHHLSVLDAAEAVGEASNRIFDIAYNLGKQHGLNEKKQPEPATLTTNCAVCGTPMIEMNGDFFTELDKCPGCGKERQQ